MSKKKKSAFDTENYLTKGLFLNIRKTWWKKLFYKNTIAIKIEHFMLCYVLSFLLTLKHTIFWNWVERKFDGRHCTVIEGGGEKAWPKNGADLTNKPLTSPYTLRKVVYIMCIIFHWVFMFHKVTILRAVSNDKRVTLCSLREWITIEINAFHLKI